MQGTSLEVEENQGFPLHILQSVERSKAERYARPGANDYLPPRSELRFQGALDQLVTQDNLQLPRTHAVDIHLEASCIPQPDRQEAVFKSFALGGGDKFSDLIGPVCQKIRIAELTNGYLLNLIGNGSGVRKPAVYEEAEITYARSACQT